MCALLPGLHPGERTQEGLQSDWNRRRQAETTERVKHIYVIHRICLISRRILFRHGFQWEGYVLFNDMLNTFYLWLYGVGHMVKRTLRY